MTPAQVAELLTYCAAFDRRTLGKADVLAWSPLLATIEFDEAREAVATHYAASTRWIMPADIRDAVHAQHKARLERHSDPTPLADPDDPEAYRRELIATRRAVAAGRREPTSHELVAGPMDPEVAKRLAALGSYIPKSVDEELAAYRPVKAARRVAILADRPDALAVACPYCRAEPGQPCRINRIDAAGRTARRRKSEPHPGRVDAARTAEATA